MRAGSHTLPVVLALVGKIAEDSYNDSFEERHSLLQVAAEQEAARDAGEEDEGPLEVEGFLFKRLLERKPEKRQELLTLRDHLLASSSSSDTLKVTHCALTLAGCHTSNQCPLCLDALLYFMARSGVPQDSSAGMLLIGTTLQMPHTISGAMRLA